MKDFDPASLCMSCMNPLRGDESYCPACGNKSGALQNQPGQLPIPSILNGTFLVGRALGQGGFGITYIGFDLNLALRVAIKEYYPQGLVAREDTARGTLVPLTGERGDLFLKGRDRFVEEARTLARFTSEPGVVNVRSYFQENGTAYIVMDYVEGETLKQHAAHSGGKLPVCEVLTLVQPVIRALSKVHAVGLLHRDISPDNIIIREEDGQTVLLDFGAARQISATGERSNTINVKHGYAPEEQYRTRGEQGPWSDVYALCATVYKLITGVTPPQAMDRIMEDELLTPPTQMGIALDPVVEAALLKGLSVRGRDRQQSMTELYESLYGKPAQTVMQPTASEITPASESPLPAEADTAVHIANEDTPASEDDAPAPNAVPVQETDAESAPGSALRKKPPNTRKILIWAAALVLCAGVILGAVILTSPESVLARAENSFEQAQKAFEEGKDEKGINALKSAAKNGYAPALYELGNRYLEGNGVEQSGTDAFDCFERAVDIDFYYSEAMFALGRCYQEGIGVEKDAEAAGTAFCLAASDGLPEAQFEAGRYLSGTGYSEDGEKAFQLYSDAAEKGYAPAQDELGFCYQSGFFTEVDDHEAVRWYSKAAEQGFAPGQRDLGICYLWGVGVEQDEAEGVRLLTLAAEQEDATAQYELGKCCAEGRGIEQNADEAVRWFLLAAEQGFADAQDELDKYSGEG